MNLIELIQISANNVMSQGLKSTLTILGVVIGIATIIALISLGQGLNTVVEKQFELMGMNTIMVEPGSAENMITSGFATMRSTDRKIIESVQGVKRVIPFYEGSVIMKVKKEEKEAVFLGVDTSQTDYLTEIGYLDLEEGRNLRQGDKYSVIIYKDLAENGFEQKLNVRESIEMNGKKFRIIGISKDSTMIGLTGMTMIIISEQAAKEIFNAEDPIEIAVLANSKEVVPEASAEIERLLEKDHGEKDFYLMTTDQMLDSANIILGILQIFLLGLGMISLLVGGIGIMNTMLMSVIERTQEIGLMK
ncbi:MAG: ABC transporter permease, partial [Candidatus Diapherotrites archaeon]|nr:ABC transporter permease [Candidatus Diapherotrites archaeon]